MWPLISLALLIISLMLGAYARYLTLAEPERRKNRERAMSAYELMCEENLKRRLEEFANTIDTKGLWSLEGHEMIKKI